MNLQAIFQINRDDDKGWLDYSREQPASRENAQAMLDAHQRRVDRGDHPSLNQWDADKGSKFRIRLEDWDNPQPHDEVPVLTPFADEAPDDMRWSRLEGLRRT